ncbi:MAG TPA: hypothetical protein VMS17_05680 [Gemmataceae bacterium]|nr:hypothetical protein [Gemmataceae bacterium]
MVRRLGMALQVIGFFMVPLAVVAQISPVNQISLGTSLTFSAIGIAIFFLGRMMQTGGRR